MLMFPAVIAQEEGMRQIGDFGSVWDYDGISSSPAFSFVTALGDYTVTNKYIASSTSYVATKYGNKCEVGEYIALLACSDVQGKNCQRIFQDDYKKQLSTDTLDITEWANQDWFVQARTGKYMAYECRKPKVSETESKPTGYGKVLSVSSPSKVYSGETVRVTGTYKSIVNSPFILEATIDPNSRTTFAVIRSDTSSCDGSKFVAGKKVNGVAGTTYDYDLTFTAPLAAGNYNLIVYSYTDCYKDGGQFINSWQKTISVEERKDCNLLAKATELFKKKIAIPDWYSLTQNELGNCAVKDLVNYCGSIDTDKDTVPDKCDYCPQEKGAVDAQAIGCHPCFGKAATSTCWDAYKSSYGIPTAIESARNPVIGTKQKCNGDTIQICLERKDGSLSECKDKEECIACSGTQSTGFKCTNTQTLTSKNIEKCVNNNVWVVAQYSDGSEKNLAQSEPCKYGCQDGSCNAAPASTTLNGGDDSISKTGDTGVSANKNVCSSDANCPAATKCDANTNQCIPFNSDISACIINTDCTDGTICSTDIGVCVDPVVSECIVDLDCADDQLCVGTICVAKDVSETVIEGTNNACTEDQIQICEDGSTVVNAKCVDGELWPLVNFCKENSPDGDGTFDWLTGAPSNPDATVTIPGTNKTISSSMILIIIVIIGILGYYFYPSIMNMMGKKKRR